MCFWCFQRSFGEPKPDSTPQGLAQPRKGVSYEPRRSILGIKIITVPSLSRSLANLQGVVDLSAYTFRPMVGCPAPQTPAMVPAMARGDGKILEVFFRRSDRNGTSFEGVLRMNGDTVHYSGKKNLQTAKMCDLSSLPGTAPVKATCGPRRPLAKKMLQGSRYIETQDDVPVRHKKTWPVAESGHTHCLTMSLLLWSYVYVLRRYLLAGTWTGILLGILPGILLGPLPAMVDYGQILLGIARR